MGLALAIHKDVRVSSCSSDVEGSAGSGFIVINKSKT